MQQITVTQKNGVVLVENITVAIDPEKIVSVKSVGGYAEIVYAKREDRRVSTDTYLTTNTKTQVDAFISGEKLSLTVYDTASGATSALTVQKKYTKELVAAKANIAGTNTDCVQVTILRGSFAEDIVYASGAIGDYSTAVPTTTTTTAAATTTTTAAPTTTTTTAAPTTTTTAAPTTTTTEAPTTTTTEAPTTTTTAAPTTTTTTG